MPKFDRGGQGDTLERSTESARSIEGTFLGRHKPAKGGAGEGQRDAGVYPSRFQAKTPTTKKRSWNGQIAAPWTTRGRSIILEIA